jgi:hypothetical protein
MVGTTGNSRLLLAFGEHLQMASGDSFLLNQENKRTVVC